MCNFTFFQILSFFIYWKFDIGNSIIVNCINVERGTRSSYKWEDARGKKEGRYFLKCPFQNM
jgi:uncharacterized protein involved in tolerance to divalent cations